MEETDRMQKSNLTKVFNSMKIATVKHSPEILMGIGITGMVTTTVMAVRATPKARCVMILFLEDILNLIWKR